MTTTVIPLGTALNSHARRTRRQTTCENSKREQEHQPCRPKLTGDLNRGLHCSYPEHERHRTRSNQYRPLIPSAKDPVTTACHWHAAHPRDLKTESSLDHANDQTDHRGTFNHGCHDHHRTADVTGNFRLTCHALESRH